MAQEGKVDLGFLAKLGGLRALDVNGGLRGCQFRGAGAWGRAQADRGEKGARWGSDRGRKWRSGGAGIKLDRGEMNRK
jgi:hypothetical protein